MTIQRYSITCDVAGEPCMGRHPHGGKYVLFTDAEADKAEAVAEAVSAEQEKTAGMKAELVHTLAIIFPYHCESEGGWFRPIGFHPATYFGVRLWELGAWEREERDHVSWYRPIELQDSGGSDEN